MPFSSHPTHSRISLCTGDTQCVFHTGLIDLKSVLDTPSTSQYSKCTPILFLYTRPTPFFPHPVYTRHFTFHRIQLIHLQTQLLHKINTFHLISTHIRYLIFAPETLNVFSYTSRRLGYTYALDIPLISKADTFLFTFLFISYPQQVSDFCVQDTYSINLHTPFIHQFNTSFSLSYSYQVQICHALKSACLKFGLERFFMSRLQFSKCFLDMKT